ncbi:MAG: 1-deoxy-D-xylulose-5-phosphate reductoisomerase, partial [Acidobacteriota bacterium]|nr:1-deoxy-D-xylulose-5-phosphate reductoisomerase [Acidobacteriota bacterium]
MKTLSILGSTGSIGTNTLKLIAEFPKDFRVAGLCAGKNADILARQAEETCPEIVS